MLNIFLENLCGDIYRVRRVEISIIGKIGVRNIDLNKKKVANIDELQQELKQVENGLDKTYFYICHERIIF